MAIVTCRNESCASNGQGVELDLTYPDPDTGAALEVDTVVCGACSQPITDRSFSVVRITP